jgi:hypothetical protein
VFGGSTQDVTSSAIQGRISILGPKPCEFQRTFTELDFLGFYEPGKSFNLPIY